MQRGAAYIRVSTEDQLEFSPDAQKRAIGEYARKNNILLEEPYIFVDEGISGRKAEKRPAFMQMIAAAKSKPHSPFDVILVHKFDRFARNREDSVVYKSLLRKECGVRVISITEQLEEDKFSIILESMLEAMAEYYSLNLADEVKKGMFEKARRGEHIGKAPYGYDVIHGKLAANPHEFSVVQMIFQMFVQEKESISFITKYLNDRGIPTKSGGAWRNATVSYLLHNHVYTGLTRYNYVKANKSINDPSEWILAQGAHSPAITKETFDRAQQLLAVNTRLLRPKGKTTPIKSWCQQLMVCAKCGAVLTVSTCNHGKYAAFRCPNLCTRCTWSVRKAEQLVLSVLRRDISSSYTMIVEKNSTYSTEKTAVLKENLKQLQGKMNLLKKAYLAKIDTLEEYQKNKEALQKEEREIKKDLEEKEILPEITEIQRDLLSGSLPTDVKHKIARQFIQEILADLSDKKIQVVYYAE